MGAAIDGRLLGRRLLLGTALIVAALIAAAAYGLLRIHEQDQRSEIGIALSHLSENVARLDLAARMMIDEPSPRGRLLLRVAYLSTLYHAHEILKTDPAGGVRGRGLREENQAALDAMAERWLGQFRPPHDHALGAYPMSPEILELWRGRNGAQGLEASLTTLLDLLEGPAMRGEDFATDAAAYHMAADAEIRRMIILLRRGSVLSAEEQDRAAALARMAVLIGCGVGVAAALLNHALVLRPMRRRILRDRALLAEALRGAKAGDKAKSEFLSTVSHELRTPLNGVLGMASLLESTDLDTRQRSFVETIRQSALSLLTVIEDMLVFTRPDFAQLTPNQKRFTLVELGAAPIARLAPAAALKGVELIVRRAPGGPAALKGDRSKLDHVIANLLGNAVKFTDRGEIVLDISARETAAKGALLRVEISDTGRGVAHEDAERIFGLFRQADQSATRSAGGLGLGLTVCTALMRLMGGRLGMRSCGAGEGATFWLEVELQVSGENDAADEGLPRALAGRRALFVSASAARRKVGAEILAGLGAAHEMAADAGAALARLSSKGEAPPDFVVLDDHRPAVDSDALRARIRGLEGCEGVAVILLKAPGAAAGSHRDDPLAEILIKPTTMASALAAIEAVLQRADAADDRAGGAGERAVA